MKLIIPQLVLFLSSLSVFAQTTIDDNIIESTSWTKNNSPYIVTNMITVLDTVELTIEPGVIIKIDYYDFYDAIIVKGHIKALGTASEPIVFTSIKDDEFGGDTNNDGSSSLPSPGNWGGITLNSEIDSASLFEHCLFRYGSAVNLTEDGTLKILSGNVSIKDSKFYQCNRGIIIASTGTVEVIGNTLEEIENVPIACSFSAMGIDLSDNTFLNNKINGLGIIPYKYSTSDNYVLNKKNVAGIENISYVIFPGTNGLGFEIGEDVSLTINPGVILKSIILNYSDAITIIGSIKAIATASEPIVFTSIKDDEYGGDTNNDGSDSSPSPGDWGAITLNSELDNTSKFENCLFRYASYDNEEAAGTLKILSGNISIKDSRFYRCYRGIILASTGTVDISGNTLEEIEEVPIACSLSAMEADLSDNTYLNNKINGLGIAPYTYNTSKNYVLSKKKVAGIENISYVIYPRTNGIGGFEIGEDVSLTINPGVILKSITYNFVDAITVVGSIIALGTASEPIVFTSIKDDGYGGDTNNDGSNSLPSPGDWGAITLNSEIDNTSLFEHCLFRYGSGSLGTEAGTMKILSGNVSIKDSKFYQCNRGIIIASTGTVEVRGNTLEEIENVPIACSFSAMGIDLSDNTFLNNKINGLGIIPYTYNMSQNYVLSKKNVAGIENISYVIYPGSNGIGGIEIGEEASLTINPGVILKPITLDFDNPITILGYIKAMGTISEPIIFTSIKDDTYGGDTNNDGGASAPKIDDWGSIKIGTGGNDESVLEYCHIRHGGYAQGAIYINGSAPEINHCTFDNNKSGIYIETEKDTYFSNNLFIYNKVAIHSNLSTAKINVDSSNFSNNETGIYLAGGLADIHHSHFLDNSEFDISNNTVNDINAKSNWYGFEIFKEIAKGNNPKNLSNLFDRFDNINYGTIDYSTFLTPLSDIYESEPAVSAYINNYDTLHLLAHPVFPDSRIILHNESNGFWYPTNVVYIDSININAYLDFSSAELGIYDVMLINGNDTLKKENAYSLLEAETPFGVWVDFEGEPGKKYVSGVALPNAERIYCMLKKETHLNFSGTWRGGINVLNNDNLVISESRNIGDDILLTLENIHSGYYPYEIYNTVNTHGNGKIKFCLEPDSLILNKWNISEILRPYGYDWKLIELDENLEELVIQTEGFGLGSYIEVYYGFIGNLNENWIFSNLYANYRIKGVIQNPKAGKYYVKYMDSAVLEDENGVFKQNQTRQYLIYVGAERDIPDLEDDLLITHLSSDTLYNGISTLQVFGRGFHATDTIQLREKDGDSYIIGSFSDTILTKGYINVKFDLSEALEGEWYISILRDKELTHFEDITLQIIDRNSVNIDFKIIAREQFRVGRFQPVVVQISNLGGSDLHMVPVTMTLPKGILVEVRNLQKIAYDSDSDLFDPNEIPIDVENPHDINLNDITLIIPSLIPKQEYELVFWINPQTLGEFSYSLSIFEPLVYPDIFNSNSGRISAISGEDCLDKLRREDIESRFKSLINDAFGISDISACADAIKTSINNAIKNSTIGNESAGSNDPHSLSQTVGAAFEGAFKCLKTRYSITLIGPQIAVVTNLFNNINDKLSKVSACLDEQKNPHPSNNPSGTQEKNKKGNGVGSSTPEEKYGPMGAASVINDSVSHHYIDSSRSFDYRIDYWNKEDATAPAAIVYIRDTLDTNFDLSTFNFTEIGFLKWKAKLEGGQYFNINIDVRPDMPYIVNVEGTVDPESREVYWIHTTLDPSTMELPDDPFSGYLPPIDSTGHQIGWVNYTIEAKSSLTDGTMFTNQAFVNFDGVGKWGPAPKEGPYTNIFDYTPPISEVLSIPSISETDSIEVSWTGVDTGSGIGDYTIYVSEGVEYTIWKENIADTSAYFQGEIDKTYRLFSIARDKVGNIEAYKENHEAIVTFIDKITGINNPIEDEEIVSIFPNPSENCFNVRLREQSMSDVIYQIYTGTGQLIDSRVSKTSNWVIDMNGYNKGFYLIKIFYNDRIISKKIILQ